MGCNEMKLSPIVFLIYVVVLPGAVDDRSLYAVSLTSGIYRFDKSGVQPVKLVPVERKLVKFAIDAQNLFWSNYDEGTIMRLRK